MHTTHQKSSDPMHRRRAHPWRAHRRARAPSRSRNARGVAPKRCRNRALNVDRSPNPASNATAAIEACEVRSASAARCIRVASRC